PIPPCSSPFPYTTLFRSVVAGHHDHLHVVAVDEQLADLAGEVAHLLEAPGTVRVAARVTEVDEVLVGQQVDQGPGDGETAEPARSEEHTSELQSRFDLVC